MPGTRGESRIPAQLPPQRWNLEWRVEQANPLRDGRNFGAVPNGTPLIHCGVEMPADGCTVETGTVYLSEND
jgi:hypothetical protein